MIRRVGDRTGFLFPALGLIFIFLVILFVAQYCGVGPSPPMSEKTVTIEKTVPGPERTVLVPEEPSPFDEVASAMSKSLKQGYIGFTAPDEIKLGDTETIQLLLSPAASSEEELQQQLTTSGSKEGAQVLLSNRMQARLTGSGFKIEAISPEEQYIDPAQTTEWKWDITPTKTGKQTLHLTLTALIKVEGQEGTRQIRSFDHPINVDVTWGQRLESIGGFITSNWQWFWTVVLVPIVLWIYRRYKKNNERHDSEQPPSSEGGD